ncbi:MAG: 2-succinyl-5-enolpyruvyl-6-hydroxy-3-cyclohexene-1-carboxylic-acid synthase [bacterium]
MKIDININYLISSVFIKRLQALGVKHALISPGSRNTPLVCVLAECTEITKTVIIDERSSSFFALGTAKVSNTPVLIVTTSGTAVAELYPAIVEAYQNRIPLIICTADRPAELLDCGANQTINQDNIFANHIRMYYNIKQFNTTEESLNKLLDITEEVYLIATRFDSGPVHINFPFDKPLEPESFTTNINSDVFEKINESVNKPITDFSNNYNLVSKKITNVAEKLKSLRKGIIIVGPGNYSTEFFDQCLLFAKMFNFPIFADALSSFRFYKSSNKFLLNNYPIFLANELIFEKLQAEIIIQFGKTPTAKYLLEYFGKSNAYKILINTFGGLFDPSKSADLILGIDELKFLKTLLSDLNEFDLSPNSTWFDLIKGLDDIAETVKSKTIIDADFPFEGKIVLEVLKNVPQNSNLVLANSMPPRDLDYYAGSVDNNVTVYCNRGASGIDGNTATAAGIAANCLQNTYFITGDLSFLHDIGSLFVLKQQDIRLCVVLINNNGGGIFNMLPISKNENVFEKYFLTPHNLSFKEIVKGFGGNYCIINSWEHLKTELAKFEISTGYTILEIQTNSQISAIARNNYKQAVINEITNKIN